MQAFIRSCSFFLSFLLCWCFFVSEVMDGLASTRSIRSWYDERLRSLGSAQAAGSPPIILALTANAMLADRQKCMEAGVDAVATKPISFTTLHAQLMQWGRPTETNG
jgi:CheY-like chemotaxis protein